MATLNARMRLLYDKNYTAKGSPMRRYDNPYYIASSQRLLYDILQQQTAKKTSTVNTTRQPVAMASSAPVSSAPAKMTRTASAPVKASERKPPVKVVIPAKGTTTPAKGKTGNLRGKTTELSKAAAAAAAKAGKTSNIPSAAQMVKKPKPPAFGKKQGASTKITDAAEDEDDDAVVTKSKTKANPAAYITKQGKIKGHENALANSLEATWKKENDALIKKKNATLARVEALQKKVKILSGKSDPPLLKKLSDAEDQYEKENTVTQLHTKAQPSVTYTKTRETKAKYKEDRAKLVAIDAENQKQLDAEMKSSGGQSSTKFLKIKGRKRYWKARLKELDAANSKGGN